MRSPTSLSALPALLARRMAWVKLIGSLLILVLVIIAAAISLL